MDIEVYDKKDVIRCIEILSVEFSMKSYEIVEILTEYYPQIQDFLGGGSYLEELPNEMLFEIIKYLSKDELSSLCMTSKRMSEFCSDPYYINHLTVKDIELWYFPMTPERIQHNSFLQRKGMDYRTEIFFIAFGRTGVKLTTPLGFWVKNENISISDGIVRFTTDKRLDLNKEDKIRLDPHLPDNDTEDEIQFVDLKYIANNTTRTLAKNIDGRYDDWLRKLETNIEGEYKTKIRFVKDTHLPVMESYARRGIRIKATSNTRSLDLDELDKLYYSQVHRAKLNKKLIQEQNIYSRLEKVTTDSRSIWVFNEWDIQSYEWRGFGLTFFRPYIP